MIQMGHFRRGVTRAHTLATLRPNRYAVRRVVLEPEQDGVDAPVDTQLMEDGLYVVADGGRADAEPIRDRLRGQSRGEQPQDLSLAIGERSRESWIHPCASRTGGAAANVVVSGSR